ncbi:MAG: hypothetical protein CL681_08320, partial [Blastopirellula sp.]|nr:hypothetical protein [Blastopirellula sp.]
PEDRRGFIEEAAGILKHRRRFIVCSQGIAKKPGDFRGFLLPKVSSAAEFLLGFSVRRYVAAFQG